MKHIGVLITGASGASLALRALDALSGYGLRIDLVCSREGQTNLLLESGHSPAQIRALDADGRLQRIAGLLPGQVRLWEPDDFFCPLASGSNAPDALLAIPASMGFCARIAQGLAGSLAERAADVCFKERRRLVLVPRETPLSAVHLENLARLAHLGADIMPFMPEFYTGAAGLDAQAGQFVGRLLQLLGLENAAHRRWSDDAGSDVRNACFGCSPGNPMGLQLEFEMDPDQLRSSAEFRLEPHWQSWERVVHGGILATILDEAMGKIASMRGYMAMTGQLDVRYRQPLRALEPARVEAELETRRWKSARGTARIRRTSDDALIAEASGRFLVTGRVPPGIG